MSTEPRHVGICSRCGLPVVKGGNSPKVLLCRDCVFTMNKQEIQHWRAS